MLVDWRTWTGAALILLTSSAAAEDPIFDLTGCEAADAQGSENGNLITILWRCPSGQAWRVLYKAVSVRLVVLAKPVPSPTLKEEKQ